MTVDDEEDAMKHEKDEDEHLRRNRNLALKMQKILRVSISIIIFYK